MSCYNNKEKYNFLACKTSNGKKALSFVDTRTEPESVMGLMRELLSDGTNSVKRRAFQMFMMINQYTSSKPDLTGGMLNDYSTLAEAIFKPFIDGYGKYNVNINFSKESNLIRMKVSQYIKRITGCGNVSVIFKAPTQLSATDEICFYINDSNVSNGGNFNYKVDNSGLNVNNTTSITMSISLRYVSSMISKAYHHCMTEFTKNSVKIMMVDQRLITAMIAYLTDVIGRKIYKALIVALYKEQIFLRFAADTVNLVNNVIGMNLTDKSVAVIPCDFKNSVPSLNLKLLNRLLSENGINELNPHLMLDIFELFDSEINLFLMNYIRDDDRSLTYSAKYEDLHLDAGAYMDEESRATAGAVFVSKLTYCVMALMCITKNSIKESTRAEYCYLITNSLSYVKSQSKISYVTDSKDLLVDELTNQANLIKVLASDIIKLKRFAELVRGI